MNPIRTWWFRQLYAGLTVFLVLALYVACASSVSSRELKHEVQVLHPGINPSNTVACTLVQVREKETGEFYMDVDSVFCLDAKCAIVPVRLYWDELGFYNRYELAPGVQLEKAEGKFFSPEDYEKLHGILADRNSPLRDADIGKIVTYVNAGDVVDGSTGATVLLHRDAAVKGAAWTCYTLWHWANGGVVPIIRQITADASSLDDLRADLENGDETRKIFALEQLTSRKAYDQPSVDAVIGQVQQGNEDLTKLALQYLNEAPAATYYSSMAQLFLAGNTKQRVMYLISLMETPHDPPPGYLDRLSRRLPGLESYYEAHLLLNLMTARNPSSADVVKQALPLLENKSFLVARRGYWFLREQQLSPDQQNTVDAFQRKYDDRL